MPDPGPGLRRDPLTDDSTWPVIELERGTNVEGIVVDGAGQPAADATVYFVGDHVDEPGRGTPPSATRPASLSSNSFPQAARYRSRHGPIRPPQRIRRPWPWAHRGPAAIGRLPSGQRADGVLVDDLGQPIHQAEVYLNGWWSTGSKWNFHVASGRSDAQGALKSAACGPANMISNALRARPSCSSGPKPTYGRANRSISARSCSIAHRRTMKGSVLDSAGKPLEGVEIFHSGDAPARLSARTDAAGRFRVQGFRTGPAYLFAQQPGYRFQAVLANSRATDVTIRLLRGDEPLPPRPPSKRLSDEQRCALALRHARHTILGRW